MSPMASPTTSLTIVYSTVIQAQIKGALVSDVSLTAEQGYQWLDIIQSSSI